MLTRFEVSFLRFMVLHRRGSRFLNIDLIGKVTWFKVVNYDVMPLKNDVISFDEYS